MARCAGADRRDRACAVTHNGSQAEHRRVGRGDQHRQTARPRPPATPDPQHNRQPEGGAANGEPSSYLDHARGVH